MFIEKENKKLQFTYFILIPLLVIFRDVLGIEINKIFFISIQIIFVLLSGKKDLIYIIVFIFPFLCGVPGTYIMLINLIAYMYKFKQVNKKVFLFSLYAFILEVFVSIVFKNFKLVDIIQYVEYLMIFLLLIYNKMNINYKKIIQISIGSFLSTVLIIAVESVQKAPQNWFYLFRKGWYRFGDKFRTIEDGMTLSLNANNLAYYCIVGISISLLLFIKEKNKLIKIIYFFCMILFLIIGALSLSRSFVLVLLIIIFLIFVSNVKNLKKMLLGIFFIFIFVGAAIIILQKNTLILEGMITRFTSETMSTGGGRTTLTISTFTEWIGNYFYVLFGTSISSYNETMVGKAGQIHCGLLQILYVYGIIAAPILLYILINPVYILHKKYRIEIIYFIPWVSVIIFTQTIQFLNPTFLMFPYLLGIYSIKYGKTMERRSYKWKRC